MPNATVRCERCGATREVRFASCVASGWPACCGVTMRLAPTRCRIAEEPAAARRRLGRPRTPERIAGGPARWLPPGFTPGGESAAERMVNRRLNALKGLGTGLLRRW